MVELVESEGEGAWCVPIPTDLADEVEAALKAAGITDFAIEGNPKKSKGWPYSTHRAAEILARDMPDLYGYNPARVTASLLATKVEPALVYDLVRELDEREGYWSPSAMARRTRPVKPDEDELDQKLSEAIFQGTFWGGIDMSPLDEEEVRGWRSDDE